MYKKKTVFFLVLTAAFNMIFGSQYLANPLPAAAGQVIAAVSQTSTNQSEVARQIIVRLKDIKPETVASQVGAKVLKKGPLDFATLVVQAGENPDEIIKQLRTKQGVVSAERNSLKKIVSINVSDPMYADEYNLNITNVPEAWSSGAAGQGITIAVLDTGVDLNHPDLKNKLVGGYNAILDSTDLKAVQDDNGHGTHVAGIAAAELNNSGIVGVAYQAKIMPVKVMDKAGEGADDIIAAGIVWAVNHGAGIINLSMGSDSETAVLRSAVEYAVENGVLVVAAAGNFDPLKENNPGISYPACYPQVIAVTATDRADQIARISAAGPESVLSAPGMDIVSAYWTKEKGSTYAVADGTSMASSFVGGVAALIWSKHPDWPAGQVKIALENGAKDLGVPGRDDQYGFGRVDAGLSVSAYEPVQGLNTPANITALGGLVKGAVGSQADLLVPAKAFSQSVQLDLKKVSSPENLPSEILPGGPAFAVDFTGNPQKMLTLTVQAQIPAGSSGLMGYIYRWSGSRWIPVGGGGTTANQIKAGIYEPGIYQAGYAPGLKITRLAGKNRRETAIEIAKAAFPAGTDTVLLAREDDFPDALSGVPLAYKEHAPILLTNSQSLPAEVLAEIKRLAPEKIILLGSTGVISEQVQSQLSSQGYQVNRIGGANRYATASAIAQALGTTGKAIVVNGENFPDALAVASQAARNGEPILLTDAQMINPETESSLRQLSVTETLVIGGEARVSGLVFGQLSGARRLAGSDRYETAADVFLEYPVTGSVIYLATGEDFPDALTGGLLAALQGTNLLLVSPTGRSDLLGEVLQNREGMEAVALGGPNLVPERILNIIKELIR
jgi:subtilisin family serine protease/putative cell wall-binding protein